MRQAFARRAGRRPCEAQRGAGFGPVEPIQACSCFAMAGLSFFRAASSRRASLFLPVTQ